jgi:hypothetical protein
MTDNFKEIGSLFGRNALAADAPARDAPGKDAPGKDNQNIG